jgi:DNA-directed RNA polymerase specialized sigma24 family protein
MSMEDLKAIAAEYVDHLTAKAIVEEAVMKLPSLVRDMAAEEQRKQVPELPATRQTRYDKWLATDPSRTEKTLLQLSDPERQAFRAVYLDGLTLGEAADLLAIPINTVKIRAQTALRAVARGGRSAA